MKYLIAVCIFFCLSCFSFFSFSQTEALLQKEKQLSSLIGQDKIELLLEISEGYLKVDALRSIELIQEVEDMIGKPSKKNYKEGVMLSDAYYTKGLAQQKLNEHDEAVEDFLRSFNTANKFDYTYGKNRAEKMLNDLNVNTGSWFSRKLNDLSHLEIDEKVKDVTSGIQTATKAITIREREVRIEKYITLAEEAEQNSNYTLAIDHYQKALSVAKMLTDDQLTLNLYLYIADLFIKKRNNELAVVVYDSAILFVSASDYFKENENITDSIIHLKNNVYTPQSITEETTLSPQPVTLLSDSLIDLEEEITKNLINQEEVKAKMESFEEVALKSEKAGDYEKALQYRELYFAAKNKFFQDSIENIARISKLEESRRLQSIEIKNQTRLLEEEKNTKLLLIASSVLLALLAIVSFYAFRNKRNSHNKLGQAYNELEATLKALRETQVKLIESEKMASLGQLTAGIAHEINNPINFVTSNISPLKKDIEDVKQFYIAFNEMAEKQGEKIPESLLKLRDALDLDFLVQEMYHLLNGIEEGAFRTKEIVESFRNFARLDEEGFKKVDLKDSVQSAFNLLAKKVGEGISFTSSFGEDTYCECQVAKINQVMFHLLNNAIQALNDGKGEVEVHIRTIADKVEIKVRDNGIGIKEEIAHKIYDPFFTTRQIGDGKGLGLSIAYGIVQEHNGEIAFETCTGENAFTEFVITLPKYKERKSEKIEESLNEMI